MSLTFYSNYTLADFAYASSLSPASIPPGCVSLASCTFIYEYAEPKSYPTGLAAAITFFVYTLVASNKTRGQTWLPQIAALFYVIASIMIQVGFMYKDTYFPGSSRAALRAVAWILDYLSRVTVILCFYRLYHDFDKYFSKGLDPNARQEDVVLADTKVIFHLIDFNVDTSYIYQRAYSIFVFVLNFALLISAIVGEARWTSTAPEQVWYGGDLAWIIPFSGLGYKIFRTLNYNVMTTNLATVNNPVFVGLANPANSFLLTRMAYICVFSIFWGVTQTVLWSVQGTGYVFDYNHIWAIACTGSRLVALELLCGCFDQMAYHVEKATKTVASTSSSGTKAGTGTYSTSDQKNTVSSSYYQSTTGTADESRV